MIDEPQNARSQRTRDAILEATYELLQEGGAASVTMAAVAERAGCSRRALYLHVASRAELLVAMIAYADRRFDHEGHVRTLREAEDPVALLRAFGRFLGAYHTKIAPLVRAIDRERESDDAARACWEVATAGWRAGASQVVGRLEAAGVLHPRFESTEDAVDLVYALTSVDLIRALVDERGWSAEKYGEHMGETFVALLLSDAARSGRVPSRADVTPRDLPPARRDPRADARTEPPARRRRGRGRS